MCPRTAGTDAEDAHSAALLSYLQLLALLPRHQACSVTVRHVREVLSGQQPPPQQHQQQQQLGPAGQQLPTSLTPGAAGAALSLLAACGHATRRQQPSCAPLGQEDPQGCSAPAGQEECSSERHSTDAHDVLHSLASDLLLKAAGSMCGSRNADTAEYEALQLVSTI